MSSNIRVKKIATLQAVIYHTENSHQILLSNVPDVITGKGKRKKKLPKQLWRLMMGC